MIGSVVFGQFCFCLITYGANDCCPKVMGPLAGNETRSTSCCVHENCVVRGDRIGTSQQITCGQSLQQACRNHLVADAFRDPNEPARRHDVCFRVRAQAARICDMIPNRNIGNVLPNGLNHSSGFYTESGR